MPLSCWLHDYLFFFSILVLKTTFSEVPPTPVLETKYMKKKDQCEERGFVLP